MLGAVVHLAALAAARDTETVRIPAEPVAARTEPAAEPDRSVPDADRHAIEPTGTAKRSDAELLREFEALAERSGGTPSLTSVRTGLRVGTGRARRLLDQLGA